MLQKGLDKGFNGFQVPFIPRSARSSRKRSLVQKRAGDGQLCAFDLLATVAGEILLEKESSRLTPPGTDVQDVILEDNELGNQSSVVEHHDEGSAEIASPSLTLELGIRGLQKDQIVNNGSLLKIDLNGDSHGIEGPEMYDGKPAELVSSDGSVKFTLSSDHYPCSSQSPYRDNYVNLVSKDDDENYSECIQPSTMKAARFPTHIGHCKIRKLFSSKYWRMASRARDGDLSDTVFDRTEARCFFRRRTGYKCPRSKRIYPFKRRRIYHYSSLSSSHADIGYKGNVSSSHVAGPSTTFSRESHVKLRIKSFHVPELFIEMPGAATIGSLKRTVMQAVSALLGGGLCVGVLSQGKKIRDDNRTLLQSGICNDNKVGSLGFSLEPNPPRVDAPVSSEENSAVLSSGLPQPVSRCPITNVINQGTAHLSPDIGKFIESDHDSTPSPADLSEEKGAVASQAIVARLEGNPQALAVVHPHQKTNRSAMFQRRIRRPFSVSEVEALVLAVEQIGTGRWRDVKLRAFDNAEHRTYVDLKDKWKTLVHTARIAPQRRRGQPVPQELLDRVLAAHGFWTQQQAKQDLKQPPSMTCLLL